MALSGANPTGADARSPKLQRTLHAALTRSRPQARVQLFPRTSLLSATDREQLYSELQPLVRRLIRQYGEDAEARRDLEGEVYYRYCVVFDAFDPDRGIPLRPYLIRQLSSSVYTYARQNWKRRKRETSLDLGFVDQVCADVSDPSIEWDAKILTDSFVRSLPYAIAQLPDRQRNVLISRYYDSRSFEEISMLMGIKVASTRSLLRHAIAKLRQAVMKSGQPPA